MKNDLGRKLVRLMLAYPNAEIVCEVQSDLDTKDYAAWYADLKAVEYYPAVILFGTSDCLIRYEPHEFNDFCHEYLYLYKEFVEQHTAVDRDVWTDEDMAAIENWVRDHVWECMDWKEAIFISVGEKSESSFGKHSGCR